MSNKWELGRFGYSTLGVFHNSYGNLSKLAFPARRQTERLGEFPGLELIGVETLIRGYQEDAGDPLSTVAPGRNLRIRIRYRHLLGTCDNGKI